MWEYIVTWCLVTMTLGSCPDAFKKDEFGRYYGNGMSCGVAHWETVTDCDHSKYFFSKEKALAFQKMAFSEGSPNDIFGFGSSVSSVKLDSVFVDTINTTIFTDTIKVNASIVVHGYNNKK